MKQFIQTLWRDQQANTALIFALALPILVLTVGGAIDFAQAQRIRSHIQDAADVASVASISVGSQAYRAGTNGEGHSNGSYKKGEDEARQIFLTNLSPEFQDFSPSVSTQIYRTGMELSSTVEATVYYDSTFLGIIGMDKIPVKVTSKSSASLPLFTDFYLLLDNSPSMGLGATTKDINTMVANTPDKCAFACHQMDKAGSGPTGDYYLLAKSLGVETRIDVVRQATQKLMGTAESSEVVPNQFRMAIYDFGPAAEKINPNTPGAWMISSISDDLKAAATSASAIDLMTIPHQNYNMDRQSNFISVMTNMNTLIADPGDGSTSRRPQKVLFIVSDGVMDSYDCAYSNGGTCRRITPIDPAVCKTIKDRGIRVAVLYTTYLPLPTNAFYKSWVAKYIPDQVADNMEACASPGLYFEVSPSEGISDAMNALFQKVLSVVRITS